MTTPTIAPSLDGRRVVSQDLRNLEKVRGIFASMAKFVGAQAIYQSNNPSLINFARAFEQSFRSYFETENELLLTVEQYQLIWREQVVYDVGCNTESIAFLLYKDGIGEITISSTVKREELEQFSAILKNALYNSSAQFDAATALWHAEFPNIFYRVLDEQTDGTDGEGEGSGSAGKEQPLRANDHQDITPESARPVLSRHKDSTLETLGAYLASVADEECRDAGPGERERCFQRVLGDHFTIDADALARWKAVPLATGDSDDLIVFLRMMFDFTRVRSAPPVVRDVTDTIERLIHYVRDEGRVSTLMAALELQAGLDPDALASGFASLPERIEEELTDPDYLVSLAKGSREVNRPQEVLRYLNLVGAKSVGAVCELLAHSTDDFIHEKGCEVLIDVAGADILDIIETLDAENLYLARDILYMLSQSTMKTIPPAVRRILSSSDANIRRVAISYLCGLGTDEAAQALVERLKDEDHGIRTRTLQAVVEFPHSLIVSEVTALCFAENAAARNPEELEHAFRALGKLAGESVLPQLRRTIEKKHYFTAGKVRSKREKLLAITALRYIPGLEARGLLDRLSTDGDPLVRTKALHVLKNLDAGTPTSDEWSGEHAARSKS